MGYEVGEEVNPWPDSPCYFFPTGVELFICDIGLGGVFGYGVDLVGPRDSPLSDCVCDEAGDELTILLDENLGVIPETLEWGWVGVGKFVGSWLFGWRYVQGKFCDRWCYPHSSWCFSSTISE